MRFKIGTRTVEFGKKKVMSIFLLVILVGSTLGTAVLQAFGWNAGNQNTAQQIDIPQNDIIDYELTGAQKTYLIGQGKTILRYKYAILCNSCDQQRIYLQAAVNEFSGQLFLEEIVDNSQTEPLLYVTSYYGSKTLKDPTNDKIFDSLCDLMFNPPVVCAARNV